MSAQQKTNKQHPTRRLPTARTILDGCYIDFEGFGKNKYRLSPPPILIGVYNQGESGEFRQVVFTEKYRFAAEDPRISHDVTFCNNRVDFLRELVRSSRKKRPLFGFTEHELEVISKELQQKNIVDRFLNVRSIAQQWHNSRKDRSSAPSDWDLAAAAKTTGIALTSKLPRGGVTSRFRAVREYSSSQKKWAAAPQSIRKKWREILEHNKSDVMSIRKMMMAMRGIDDS